jgi:organic radical activating enzyme
MKISQDSIILSEDGIFESIQGEGINIGCPVVFVRLQFCNLKCIWCDTKYSWKTAEGNIMSVENLAKDLKKFSSRRLVITGGEPFLQLTAVKILIKKLPDWKIEIETNGTINPGIFILKKCQLNVSPKLKNSGNEDLMRLRQEVLKVMAGSKKAYFKFVVREKSEFDEIKKIVSDCKIDNENVVIMPEGINNEEIRQKMLSLIEDVKMAGWRILPRLQVYLWENKRGV